MLRRFSMFFLVLLAGSVAANAGWTQVVPQGSRSGYFVSEFNGVFTSPTGVYQTITGGVGRTLKLSGFQYNKVSGIRNGSLFTVGVSHTGTNTAGVAYSTDGGANWSQVYFLLGFPNSRTISVFPQTASTWYAVGTINDDLGGVDGFIGKTTNGGSAWLVTTGFHELVDIDFSPTNPLFGIAVGDSGAMVETMDGGATWTELIRPGSGMINDVDFNPDGTANQGGFRYASLSAGDDPAQAIDTWTWLWDTPLANREGFVDAIDENGIPSPLFGLGQVTGGNIIYEIAIVGNGIAMATQYGGTGRLFEKRGSLSVVELYNNSSIPNSHWWIDYPLANRGYSGSDLELMRNQDPLPIQLGSFTGVRVFPATVRLNWMTITETNNYGFVVERRSAGVYDFLAFIPGSGTTLEPRWYAYVDVSAPPSVLQYRLRQIDLDGTVHYSEPITVSSPTGVDEVIPFAFELEQNYPNPFNPATKIRYSVAAPTHVSLTVFNKLGQEVTTLVEGEQPAGRYEVQYRNDNLSSGTYFYRLQAGDFVQTKKMMLVK